MSCCAACKRPFGPGKPIVKLLDKKWHKECVTCCDCGINVLGQPFYEKGGWPQCAECGDKAADAAASLGQCKICMKPIVGSAIKAFGFKMHPACANCQVCHKRLNNDGFYDDETDKILHLECIAAL